MAGKKSFSVLLVTAPPYFALQSMGVCGNNKKAFGAVTKLKYKVELTAQGFYTLGSTQQQYIRWFYGK